MQIMCDINWRLVGLLFWQSHFIMIRFVSLERDYSLSKGDMTQKGLRSQHGKDVHLHDSSDRSPAENELPTIFASM